MNEQKLKRLEKCFKIIEHEIINLKLHNSVKGVRLYKNAQLVQMLDNLNSLKGNLI